jgi:two-component system cell cycle sensor histidine kinase/response regulator CckA
MPEPGPPGLTHDPPVPSAPADGGEGLYAYLVESLGGIVWMADGETFRFSYVSPQAGRILGYPAEQWLAEPDFWRAHTHPDDVERAATFCLDATGHGRNHEFEYRMIAADGRVVWLRDVVTVAPGPGRSVRLSGIMLDVTDRKVAEAALRDSDERLALAQEAGRVGTFEWELQTDSVVFSRQAEALYGLPQGGLTSTAWFRIVHPDDLVDAVEAVQEAMDEGVLDAEYRVIWPDGSVHWLHTRGRATETNGRPRRMVGVVVDATREKADELERLRLLHTLRERVKELTALHGAARLLLGTRALPEGVLGELAALLPPAFQHPDVAAARVRLGAEEAATPGFASDADVLGAAFTTADGTEGRVDVAYLAERPAEAEGPFLAEERSLLESVAEMLRTASGRQHAEAALRESDERYRLVAKATRDILYDLDVATGRSLVSDTVSRVYGYPPGEKSTGWWREVMHPDDAERVAAAFERALAEPGDTWTTEYRLRRHDGAYLNVLDRGHIVRAPDGRAVRVVGAVMDVTERTQLEDQLRQSQKLEALGRLAAGVAHDFNNLLTVITGYSDFLLAGRQPDDPVRHDVEEIRLAADRASLLTRQLLAFGRKQARHPRVVDLNASVREVSTMLARLIGDDLALEMRLSPEGAAVLADAGQLQQVVMNLAVNARDAMPEGGTLTLATRHVRVGGADAHELGAAPGRYVVLQVSDTGIGMPREVRERIFEPFFTTKEAGRGTGLGLATVYGIVEQSHGHLRVSSEEGRGTTVEVYLPRVGVVPAGETRPDGAALPAGAGTVLLVEDDEALRRVAVRILRRSGYRVLAAADTADALRLSLSEGDPIDLLVTDVVMPGMSGPELAARIEAARPGVKVLFMSGYPDDALGRLEDGIGFIQKPFSVDALAAKVRDVLDPA